MAWHMNINTTKVGQTMQPPSLHSAFFSSLKQVEKRLKLEHQSIPSDSSSQQIPETNCKFTSTQSLSSPIYLQLDQINSTNSSSSEAPQAFLSLSPEFPPTHQNPPRINPDDRSRPTHDEETDDIDDIQRLMQLLGLKDLVQGEKERVGGGGECECEGGFYEKIVGVKGPKCEKEVERMEGWIRYFLRDSDGESETEEPLRLAYLLLGKAAFDLDGPDSGLGGLEFPSTVDEFLRHDPPNQ